MRNDGGRGVLVTLRDHELYPVRRQHLEGRGEGGDRQRMGVRAEKQGSIDPVLSPEKANGLGDGQDVPLVERLIERRSPMSRGSEGDPLFGYGRVGPFRVVRGDEPGHIHQHRNGGPLSCQGTCVHDSLAGARSIAFDGASRPMATRRDSRPTIPSVIPSSCPSVSGTRRYTLDRLRDAGCSLRYRLTVQPQWKTTAQSIPSRRTTQRKSPPRPQA